VAALPAEQAESSTSIALDLQQAIRAAGSASVKCTVAPQDRTAPPKRPQRIDGLHIVAKLLLWATRNVG
jgi:hypothetical protein